MDTAAAWQPDPTGNHEYRWWDGQRWTEHVADAGQASVDPLPADAPAPAPPGDGPPPPGGDEPTGTTGGQQGAQPEGQQPGWEQPGAAQQPDAAQQPGAQPAWGQQGAAQPPAGAQPAWGQQAAGAPPAAGASTDGVAIAAVVIGILSLLVSWIPFVGLLGLVGGIIGLVLGFVARGRIKRRNTPGNGAAITGIVTSALAVVVSIVVTIGMFTFLRQFEGGVGTFADFAECMEEVGDPDECEQILEEGLPRWFFED